MSDKFQPGDRVRCVQTNATMSANQHKVVIGQIYTVVRSAFHHKNSIILQEVNDMYPTKPGWVFHEDDFELVGKHQDVNDAWNRAMRGI